MSEKIRQLRKKYDYARIVVLASSAALLLLVQFFKNSVSMIYLLEVIACIILYFALYNNRRFSKSIRSVLVDDLQFDDYRNYFISLYDKEKKTRKKYAIYQDLCMAEGVIAHFRGEFTQSEKWLEKIEDKKVRIFTRKRYRIQQLEYHCLNNLWMSNLEEANRILSSSKKLLDKSGKRNYLMAVRDILSGQPNDYFESARPDSHLSQISMTYYRALNAKLKNENEKACTLLDSIVNEMSEIFYVQEAKKYLKKNLRKEL